MAQGGGKFTIADPLICIGKGLIDHRVIQRMYAKCALYRKA